MAHTCGSVTVIISSFWPERRSPGWSGIDIKRLSQGNCGWTAAPARSPMSTIRYRPARTLMSAPELGEAGT